MELYHFPRYEELPQISVYKDQLLEIMHGYLAPYISENITSTMINNYVKLKLIAAPEKKKYNTDQLAHLIIITLLKEVYTLDEIRFFIHYQMDGFEVSHAYNYFCQELENALNATFNTRDFSVPNTRESTEQNELLRSIVYSLAHKVYVEYRIIQLQEKD